MPELPDPGVATASALAWGEQDAVLGALLAAGVPVPRALLRWGVGLLGAGRVADAALALRSAVALAPEDAAAWTNLGLAHLRDSSTEPGGVACLKRAVALERDHPDTWLALGAAHERRGELAAAEGAYRVAVELQPTSSLSWKCLGSLLARRGNGPAAIDALTSSLAHGPPDAAVSAMLGRVLYEEGRLVEAHAAYAAAAAQEPGSVHYRRMAARTGFVRDLVEGEDVDRALDRLRTEGPGAPDPADTDRAGIVAAAASALTGFGHHDAALRLARRRVELWPDSASARYLLDALLGRSELARSPVDYLVESFDAFADSFDAQLVGVLGYDVPERLCRLVRERARPGAVHDALDAGCGTGLCGPPLRPLARRLTGVDLSSRMLERARARGVYDTLVCEELTQYLERSGGAFDLVVAADVLIYFGDLGPLFRALAGVVRAGGLLAVSAERSEGPPYRLGTSGRFAHSPGHLREVSGASFDVLASEDGTLRREGRERVEGQLLVMQRRPT